MKTIKINRDNDYVSAFSALLDEKGVKEGDKFTIKFKRGKRWKLKSFRLLNKGNFRCECCGSYTKIVFSKGEVGKLSIFQVDNHLGISSVLSLLAPLVKK